MPARDHGPAADLLALLGEERRALLAGDLAALAALTGRKEALTTALEAAEAAATPAATPTAAPERGTIRALSGAARENQALLAAAIQGLQAASARLDLARSGGPALSTYGADGRAEVHPTGKPGVERRA